MMVEGKRESIRNVFCSATGRAFFLGLSRRNKTKLIYCFALPCTWKYGFFLSLINESAEQEGKNLIMKS